MQIFGGFFTLFQGVSNGVQGCPGAFRGVQCVHIFKTGHPAQTVLPLFFTYAFLPAISVSARTNLSRSAVVVYTCGVTRTQLRACHTIFTTWIL
jgi:hypothetical protein